MQLIVEKEILIVVASLVVHCCAGKKNVIVTSQQGSPNYIPRAKKRPAKSFNLASEAVLSMMKKYNYETFVDLVEHNHISINHVT